MCSWMYNIISVDILNRRNGGIYLEEKSLKTNPQVLILQSLTTFNTSINGLLTCEWMEVAGHIQFFLCKWEVSTLIIYLFGQKRPFCYKLFKTRHLSINTDTLQATHFFKTVTSLMYSNSVTQNNY